MTTTEHDTDTGQAVIAAARAVIKHLHTEIRANRVTGEAWLNAYIKAGKGTYGETFEESDDDLPDTLIGNLVRLSGAIEAHDEQTMKDEG